MFRRPPRLLAKNKRLLSGPHRTVSRMILHTWCRRPRRRGRALVQVLLLELAPVRAGASARAKAVALAAVPGWSHSHGGLDPQSSKGFLPERRRALASPRL